MRSDKERGRDAEPAREVSEAAEAPRQRPRTRVVSEAIVAAIPAGEESKREGGADDEPGAGA